MPRPLRDQSAGIRHVTCRGNRRQPIFLDDTDRKDFLGALAHVSGIFRWRVTGWCLMTNHVHLVLEVPRETISRGMQLICGDYGQAFNWRHGYTGHLFQGRFRAEAIGEDDEKYLFEVIRYVDLNPERAGLVSTAEKWAWSSCRAHLGFEPPRPFHDVSWVRRFGGTTAGAASAYGRFLEAGRRTRPKPT